MPNSNGNKIIDYFGKPSTYNRPLISKHRIKKYIKKRFGHNLIFKNIKIYTSGLKTEEHYNTNNLRKKQIYYYTTFHYNYICDKCNINFQAGYGSGFYYNQKIDWEFISDDWDIDINRYSCNEWIIKKLLE